jgi:hypothetical protein
LHHTDEKYANTKNPYRVSGPYSRHNFGLVAIDWESESSPTVMFKVIGLDGSVAFAYTVALASVSLEGRDSAD